MRKLATWILCLPLSAAGCRAVGPGSALSSTIPMDTHIERLTYIGEVSGKACQATLLWLFALENDSSIYEAKRAALRDANTRYQRHALALTDVSIDYESTTYVVYERKCTWVRGKAFGIAAAKVAPQPLLDSAVHPPASVGAPE